MLQMRRIDSPPSSQCIKWRSDKREDLRKVEDLNHTMLQMRRIDSPPSSRKVEDLNMLFFKLMTSKP